MSEREDVNNLHSFTQAIQGLLLGVLLAYLALINFDFGHMHISLMFLPIAAIFLWPQKASKTWSLVFVFILGLFFDTLTSGPIGVWGLSYLLLFTILDGGIGQKIGGFLAFASFALTLFVVYGFVLVSGRFALSHWPDAGSLAINALASLCVFPIIYGIAMLFSGKHRARAQSKARL